MTLVPVRPALSPFDSVDPAPPADSTDRVKLRDVLLDAQAPLFERFRALFALRGLHTDEAAMAIGDAMVSDRSALLRHECAYVLGQMQLEAALPHLLKALDHDPSAMVRHEAAEALGAIATDEVIPKLRRYAAEDPSIEVRESCQLALDHIAYLRDSQRL